MSTSKKTELSLSRSRFPSPASTSTSQPGGQMRETDVPWLPEIPQHWKLARVKDTLEFFNTVRVPLPAEQRGQMSERTYDYYGASGVIDKVEDYLFDGTYILIAEDGANLVTRSQPLAFLATGKFWVNNHAHILKPRWRGDDGYFAYMLESHDYSLFVTGAAQPKLTMDNLGRFKIAVPPAHEQASIAAFLDRACRAVDEAVARKQEQLALLDKVRETTIEKAVTHGLEPNVRLVDVGQDWIVSLPAHWQPVRVKRLLSRMDYGISESTERDGRYPVLKMGNIQGGEIRFTNIEFVEYVEDDLLLEADDILYNRTNSADQVGKAAIYRGSKADGVTFASYLVRLRANHRILPAFLNFALNCGGFLSFARRLAIPSVQQSNLNSTRYGRIFVPLPPLDEQRDICAYLEAQLAQLSSIASTIEAQIDALTAYRKSLIHEYVTGQRRVPVELAAKAVAYG